MRKNTVFIYLASIILGIASFFATKANWRHFASFSTAVTISGKYFLATIFGANVFTTIHGAGTSRVYIYTTLHHVFHTLFTKVNRLKVVYLKP